jgi:DNA-binding LytR/AlgR family response regulator
MNQALKPKILLVEDEILLAEDMKMHLSEHYHITGIASSFEQATAFIEEEKPDLAILDIMLKGDRDGIDVGAAINERYHFPFIFLTSYANEQLVERAKKVRPHAYLLKPYNEYEIPIAIELALSNFERNQTSKVPGNQPNVSSEENRALLLQDSLFLRKDTAFQRVKISEIHYVEAQDNYSSVTTKYGQYLYSIVLKQLEKKLPKSHFMRVHRSYVINIEAIAGYEGNTLLVEKKRIPVSQQYREEVFNLISRL